MLVVETIAKIRRAYFLQGKAIKEICRDLHVSRKVVRKVIRSNATEFHYERSQQPLPRIGPWREQLEALLDQNDGRPARETPDADPDFRGSSRSWIWRQLRGSQALCDRLAGEACEHDGGRLRSAEFCAGRSLPVRLESRDRPDRRRDDDVEGRACPALPQPDDVRARLSSREPGDGVRRARARLRLFQGRLRARDL